MVVALPALGRQMQSESQPGLQHAFHDSQGCTEKPCIKKTKTDRQQTINQVTFKEKMMF